MIGIVSDDDFLSEVASHQATISDSTISQDSNSPINTSEEEVGPGVVIDIQKGRGSTREVPEALRKVIADCAIDGVPAKEITKAFGVSPSSISAYKVGATSTTSYHNPDQNLLGHTLNRRNRIADKATKRILQALQGITPDKLQDQSVKTLAGVAKDMSAVVKNIEPTVNGGIGSVNGPTYVIYAPRVRKEQEFQVVDASHDEF